jgi:hypothetical protein
MAIVPPSAQDVMVLQRAGPIQYTLCHEHGCDPGVLELVAAAPRRRGRQCGWRGSSARANRTQKAPVGGGPGYQTRSRVTITGILAETFTRVPQPLAARRTVGRSGLRGEDRLARSSATEDSEQRDSGAGGCLAAAVWQAGAAAAADHAVPSLATRRPAPGRALGEPVTAFCSCSSPVRTSQVAVTPVCPGSEGARRQHLPVHK